MRAQVYCRARQGMTLTFDVAEGEADIGRDSQAPLSVPVEGVSRRHARISWDGKWHWLEDLKSTNGTFLNGEIVRRDRLRHLDVITLGKDVDLIYVVRGEDYAPVAKQGIVAARLVPTSGDAGPYPLPIGETTLGRSEACNVILDSSPVSKIHARVERSASQLTLEDLGSSNGTLVNGSKTRSAVLRHGDELSLAGVDSFRVEIEMGEVAAPSGVYTGPPKVKPPADEDPGFSPEWKTRFEWSDEEREELQALQRKLAAESAARSERASAKTAKQDVQAGGEPAPKKARPPKPAARAAEPGKPGAEAGAEKPAAEAKRAPTPAPVAKAAAAPPEPKPPVEAKPPAPEPPSPPARPAPAPPKAAPAPKPAAPTGGEFLPTVVGSAASGTIAEVRLVAPSFDLSATQAGEYTVGRSSETALRVVHPTVSRRHARLIISDDRLKAFVQHDGGANGTRLNGREIERVEELSQDDEIEIGDVKLRVRIKRL